MRRAPGTARTARPWNPDLLPSPSPRPPEKPSSTPKGTWSRRGAASRQRPRSIDAPTNNRRRSHGGPRRRATGALTTCARNDEHHAVEKGRDDPEDCAPAHSILAAPPGSQRGNEECDDRAPPPAATDEDHRERNVRGEEPGERDHQERHLDSISRHLFGLSNRGAIDRVTLGAVPRTGGRTTRTVDVLRTIVTRRGAHARTRLATLVLERHQRTRVSCDGSVPFSLANLDSVFREGPELAQIRATVATRNRA
jgi:hypothetical protein